MTTLGVRSLFGRRGDDVPQQSYSSGDGDEEDEPWDLRMSRNRRQALGTSDSGDTRETTSRSSDMRILQNRPTNDDSLEDGDLPALTTLKPKQGGRVVNGQRTTTRPMQPPSLAGLSPEAAAEILAGTKTDRRMQQQQRKFWAQLEVQDDDDEEDDDPAVEEREQRSFHNQTAISMDSEEGPDDEMRARRTPADRDWLNAPRRPDEIEEYSQNLYASSGEYDNDFCSVALTTIGNICGAGFAVTPEKRPIKGNADPQGERFGKPIKSENQEEHTAIEVEFVDPTPTQAETLRKSALLSSTPGRFKEKDDASKSFEEKRRLFVTPPRQQQKAPSEEPDEEEVPLDEALSAAGHSRSTQSDLYNSFSATDKRKFIKLINSGVSPADASTQVIMDRNKESKGKASTKVMAKLAFWKKMVAAQQAKTGHQDKAIPQLKETVEDEVDHFDPDLNVVKGARKSTEEQDRDKGPVETERKPIDDSEEKKSDNTPPRATMASDAEETQALSPISGVSSEGRPFAKSGVDYYDAVQRQLDNQDEGSDVYLSGKSEVAKPQSSHRVARTIAMLTERSKSAPRSRIDSAREDRLSSSRPHEQVDVESYRAGILATSEAQKQRDRNRALPQSQGRSFEEIEERMVGESNEVLRVPVVSPDAGQSTQILPDNAGSNERTDSQLISPVSTASFDLVDTDSAKLRRREPVIPDTKVDRMARADKFDPVVVKPSNRQAIQLNSLDFNMNTYMHSTETYNTPSGMSIGGQNHDNVSVYTIGTNMTGVSTVTTSTRSRRPGAARIRIEQERRAQQVNSHKKGWHETMKAASTSTQRRWDPVRGWVGFIDEADSMVQVPSGVERVGNPTGKIHLDVEKIVPHKKLQPIRENESGEAIPVPFPKEWEMERLKMVEEAKVLGASDEVLDKVSSIPPSAKGWVETMQIASAKLAGDGAHWDPVTGWSIRREGMSSSYDEVNDEHVAGASTPNERLIDSHTREKHLYDQMNLNSKSSLEASAKSSGLDTISESEDQYVQITDYGAVHARTPPARHSPISQVTSPASSTRYDRQDQADVNVPLLSTSSSFPPDGMPNSAELSSPIATNVVKQKIGVEEFNLFQNDQAKHERVEHGSGMIHHSKTRPASTMSRQRVGPVDIDEIDQLWDEDDEDEGSDPAVEWLGNTKAREGVREAGVHVNNSVQVGLEKASDAGSSIAYSATRGRIPKLRSSKRDTSPVNSRRNNSRNRHNPVVDDRAEAITAKASHGQQEVQGNSTGLSFDELLDVQVDDEVIAGAEAHLHESNIVKQRLKQWESHTGPCDNGNAENALASDEWKSFLGRQAAKQREAMMLNAADPEGEKYESIRQRLARDPIASAEMVSNHSFEREGYNSYPFLSGPSVTSRNEANAEFEQATSEYGPSDNDNASFFRRFVECTAPIRAECHAVSSSMQTSVQETVQEMRERDSMPMAHLAFLRSNAHVQGVKSGSRYVPSNFCGREENVVVEDEEEEDNDEVVDLVATEFANVPHGNRSASPDQQPNTPLVPRAPSVTSGSYKKGSSVSSVVSDGFGAKTAYLEALALKGAVSSSKRSSSRSRSNRSTASSSTSIASSAHSEKWKSFLEKKKSRSGISPGRSIANGSDVSKAAERYTSAKLGEIMARSRQQNAETDRLSARGEPRAVVAANDLAASRVEAMVAALKNTNQSEEGEI